MTRASDSPTVTNLLANIPPRLDDELFEELASSANIRIERIVSNGHESPAGFWYDQAEPEWVMVLRGRARLRFEGNETVVVLETGDSLLIPAHARHRVEWTAQPTIWLAVHYL